MKMFDIHRDTQKKKKLGAHLRTALSIPRSVRSLAEKMLETCRQGKFDFLFHTVSQRCAIELNCDELIEVYIDWSILRLHYSFFAVGISRPQYRDG